MSLPTGPERAVRIRVPATSANLGPGFDSLGLALSLHDEVEVRLTSGGLSLEVAGEGADSVPRDEGHLVVRALRAAFDHLGAQPPGLALRCVNRVPHGRGLGSSAAAIVAGVTAARALVVDGDQRLDEDAALGLAAALEGHPDNVAACLLGGFTVAWSEAGRARAVRLDAVPELTAVVFTPTATLSTVIARGLLPAQVPHADAAGNAARAALLVAAMTTRPDLLLAATEDRLHQAYRAPAMPETAALVSRLREAGVAAVVSGAGPTVLALLAPASTSLDPAAVAPAGWSVRRLAVEPTGAVAV